MTNNSPFLALQLIKDIGSDNLKLQLDIFHLQLLEGNLTNKIKELLPYTGIPRLFSTILAAKNYSLWSTGHIQISQVPGRNEPDTEGEINYQYILGLLEKYGYDQYIGLEYNPAVNTNQSVLWMSKWGYTF